MKHILILIISIFFVCNLLADNDLNSYKKTVKEDAIPTVIYELQKFDSLHTNITDYGNWLGKYWYKNCNTLTVNSNMYWKAFVSIPIDNPTVYLTRIFLLILDDELTRVEYIKLFAVLHSNMNVIDDSEVFKIINGWQIRIISTSNILVAKGMEEFKQGNKNGAINYYTQALSLFPKNPWATYEIGLSLMTDYTLGETIRTCDVYFAKTHQYDPFFIPQKDTLRNNTIIHKVKPLYMSASNGIVRIQDLQKFSDACMKLNEWELAAYGYHSLLYITFTTNDGFDTDIVNTFTDCIKNLGAEDAAKYIKIRYNGYNKIMIQKENNNECILR